MSEQPSSNEVVEKLRRLWTDCVVEIGNLGYDQVHTLKEFAREEIERLQREADATGRRYLDLCDRYTKLCTGREPRSAASDGSVKAQRFNYGTERGIEASVDGEFAIVRYSEYSELIARTAHEPPAAPDAWMSEDGRIITNAAKETGTRVQAAASASAEFTIPLYRASQPPESSPEARMFAAAVQSLAEITKALDIPDDVASTANGNAEILDAIDALKGKASQSVLSVDAAAVLFDSHEVWTKTGQDISPSDVSAILDTVVHLIRTAETKCACCNGRGEVGGFINMESGYQNDPCPECYGKGE